MTDQEMIAQLKQQIRDDKRKIRNLSRQVKYAKETKAEMKAAAKTAKAEAAKTQKELQRALDAKKKRVPSGLSPKSREMLEQLLGKDEDLLLL